jgi:dTDP-glucose 4,6-dehydratase
MKTVLITGGSGFIGSHLVRYFLDQTEFSVVNIDKLTYAAVLVDADVGHAGGRYLREPVDVCAGSELRRILATHQPAAIMHLAAETHVDRSLDAPADFFRTNVEGTFTVIEEATNYWNALAPEEAQKFRLVVVSTDEVFGALGPSGRFDENSAYQPNSPYAATKAAGDHLARAWHKSIGLPVIITHCSNNFGPWQTPDKLIPKVITNAIRGRAIPIYGDGSQVRDWVWVEDHAKGLAAALAQGEAGERYLFGGGAEMTNLELAGTICDLLDRHRPDPAIGRRRELIEMVENRPGHDQRYAVDWQKAKNDLNWRPGKSMQSGLADTIEWYLANRQWWEPRLGDHGMDQRLGLRRRGATVPGASST